MEQPLIRYAASRDPNSNLGKTFLPQVKAVDVLITGNNADQVIMPVDANCFVRAFARVKTVVDGTSPTVDIGIATDADALIANSALDCETANDVAQSVGGIFFPAAGNVTMDVGGTGSEAGEIKVFLEIYDLSALIATPHNTVTIAAAA